ncbi:MAG: hypothetical protein LBJ67_16295 [Planctomycetaceae bacterium]|nr:hypothetical protein [Planctomycetaceae bacterium]
MAGTSGDVGGECKHAKTEEKTQLFPLAFSQKIIKIMEPQGQHVLPLSPCPSCLFFENKNAIHH